MKLKNAPFNLIALAALLLPLTLLAQKDVTKTFSGIKKIRMGIGKLCYHKERQRDG